jgi:SH3-like domain-containing protein
MGKRGVATSIAVLLALAACEGRSGEGSDCPPGVKAQTPSGYCVPRYLSLKRGEVLGRKGPGKDYDPLFVYHAKGLPVQVIDETRDWRRICDPEGAAAWVSRAMVDGRRTVMVIRGGPVALRDAPRDDARSDASLSPRAIAALSRCTGDWCEVAAQGVKGWVRTSEVWGLAPTPQCR